MSKPAEPATHRMRPITSAEGEVFYAHSRNEAGDKHLLADHLSRVATSARSFASTFAAAEWGYLAGRWHDLGKASSAFQAYLAAAESTDTHGAELRGRVDHSTAGAQHAVQQYPVLGHLLAYAISGHHSGLLDGRSDGPCLEARLAKEVETWVAVAQEDSQSPPLPLPGYLRKALGNLDAFAVAFFVRMLFSCLVDADFLDTEEFLDPGRAVSRVKWPPDQLRRMGAALHDYLEYLQRDAEPSLVNFERAAIRNACIEAATQAPGLFSLTVPTGGGKTLASLAFALRHAEVHGMSRVVYVVPFTTIIEQNADVFRRVMSTLADGNLPDPVLEHHSNLDLGQETTASLLAAENWDTPLVVTTSVQLFESLFASRSSRCRKLHSLARAVVILDEAQALPVSYLRPCLAALQELAANYGATVVLCTATQPAVHHREDFPIGLRGVREIAPDPEHLYQRLQRVAVVDLGKVDDQDITARLLSERQALCIVNTRSHARKLFDELGPGPDHFHLSALMCPVHRSAVLDEIRSRLAQGLACRVVSTQLIEAGVDIDFPVVLRSLAGIDAAAQAAGRCNRNGRLPEKGRVYLFRSPRVRSEAFFRETAGVAEQVLALHPDPLSLPAVERYFRLYYWEQSARWDQHRIFDELHLIGNDRKLPFQFGFATIADRFNLIEDSGQPIVVPWREAGMALCDQLRRAGEKAPRELLRKLQRYSVQVPKRVFADHRNSALEMVADRFAVLVHPQLHYDDQTGLTFGTKELPFLEA